MTLNSIVSAPDFLRNVLRLDALSCVACGLLQVAVPDLMAQLLGLPAALLLWTGVFLLGYAAAVAVLSTRRPIPRVLVWLLVAGNIGWAFACVMLLLAGQTVPSTMGLAYVQMQAATVAVLAELQYIGLRRAPPAPVW